MNKLHIEVLIPASQSCTTLAKSKTVILCGVCARALLTARYQLQCELNDVMIIQAGMQRYKVTSYVSKSEQVHATGKNSNRYSGREANGEYNE